MAKPAVTLRGTKGSPLTNDELDTNFENLRDATITLQADTSGTNVVAELNGTITLVAGSGITLAGDNSTKQITVTNTFGSGTLNSDSIQIGDSTTDDIVFEPPTGYTAKDVVFTTDGFILASQVGANVIRGDSGSLTLATYKEDYPFGATPTAGASIVFDQDASGGSTIAITAENTGISFGGVSGDDTLSVTGQFIVDNLTSTEIAALSAAQGAIVFNTTTSKFQGYDGTTWNDLH